MAALAKDTGSPVSFSFATWDDAMSYLFDLAAPGRGTGPFLVVIDEFPYLAKVAPELVSLIQRETDRFQTAESRMRRSLHAVLGGTPAYRRQFLADDVPGSLEEFDGRLCRTVLSPLSPLLRGARYLLAEGRCALACFGAAGFSDALRAEAAARGDVLLLGLDALYG